MPRRSSTGRRRDSQHYHGRNGWGLDWRITEDQEKRRDSSRYEYRGKLKGLNAEHMSEDEGGADDLDDFVVHDGEEDESASGSSSGESGSSGPSDSEESGLERAERIAEEQVRRSRALEKVRKRRAREKARRAEEDAKRAKRRDSRAVLDESDEEGHTEGKKPVVDLHLDDDQDPGAPSTSKRPGTGRAAPALELSSDEEEEGRGNGEGKAARALRRGTRKSDRLQETRAVPAVNPYLQQAKREKRRKARQIWDSDSGDDSSRGGGSGGEPEPEGPSSSAEPGGEGRGRAGRPARRGQRAALPDSDEEADEPAAEAEVEGVKIRKAEKEGDEPAAEADEPAAEADEPAEAGSLDSAPASEAETPKPTPTRRGSGRASAQRRGKTLSPAFARLAAARSNTEARKALTQAQFENIHERNQTDGDGDEEDDFDDLRNFISARSDSSDADLAGALDGDLTYDIDFRYDIVRCRCGCTDEVKGAEGTRWVQCDNQLCGAWEHMSCAAPREDQKFFVCYACTQRGVVAPDRESREAREARKAKRRFGWKEEALSMIRLDQAGPLDDLLRAHAFSGKALRAFLSRKTDGASVLMAAVQEGASQGCLSALTTMLEWPVFWRCLHLRDAAQRTVYHLAARLPTASCLRALLPPQGPRFTGEYALELLFEAVETDSAACCDFILGYFGVVHQQDGEGTTCAMVAASAGSEKALHSIMASIPEPNKRLALLQRTDRNGANVFHYAAGADHANIIRLCHRTCRARGWTDGVIARDGKGATPLHEAAAQGSSRACGALIEAGASVMTKDREGWIPILYAKHMKQREAILVLLVQDTAQQLEELGNLLHSSLVGFHARHILQLVVTVPECYRYLNGFLRDDRNIKLLGTPLGPGPLHFFLKSPQVLDLDVKRKYVACCVPRPHAPAGLDGFGVACEVRREKAWIDFFDLVEPLGPSEVHHLYRFHFQGEAGVGDGVKRELVEALAGGLVTRDPEDPESPLLVPAAADQDSAHYVPRGVTDGGTLRDAGPVWIADLERKFEVLGWLLGISVVQGIPLGINLAPHVLAALLDEPVDEDHFVVSDPHHHRSRAYIRDHAGIEQLDLYFSVALPTADGASVELALKPGGGSVKVTDRNKAEFLDLDRDLRLRAAGRAQAERIRQGIDAVLPLRFLQLFSAKELGLLWAGVPKLEVDAWRQHTQYQGFDSASIQVAWLWGTIGRMDDRERALLLKFCTGRSRLPAEGFRGLEFPFTVARADGASLTALPTAATCMNLLRLPPYGDRKVLEEKVLVAVRLGSRGFTFV